MRRARSRSALRASVRCASVIQSQVKAVASAHDAPGALYKKPTGLAPPPQPIGLEPTGAVKYSANAYANMSTMRARLTFGLPGSRRDTAAATATVLHTMR